MKKSSQGPAFADFIGLEKTSGRRFFPDDKSSSQMRGFFLPMFLVILFLILFFKLISLQLFEGRYYRNLSDKNRVRTETIHAPRGIIFDRNGTPLVFNSPGYRQTVNGKTEIIDQVKATELIAKGKKNIEIDSFRKYPYKDVFAHVLGYIGQISRDEFKSADFSNYKIDDLIGKEGIEKQYEKKLKGIDGKKLIEVDAAGKAVRTLGEEDPIPGENITLTIDAKLQNAAFLAMTNVKKGALIVSAPKGEILALVSKPSFDPNFFTLSDNYKAASDSAYQNISEVLLDSDNQPLLNRAISGVYPPGSTFKIITAAAGLQNNIIDENYQVEDSGVITVGAFSFGNWYFSQYGGKEGLVNVVKAIKRSNDIFFYKLAEKIGAEKLSEMGKKFGLGQKEGIDLEGEATGLVPSNDWKKKAMGESWYLGDTYHYGIGQGYLLTTPLQVNVMTQVIANSGNLYRPYLLGISNIKYQISNIINKKTFSLIREGMVESCSTGGVAWPLFELRVENGKLKIDGKNFLEVPQATTSANFKNFRKVVVACKTGTAQHGDINTMPHAWITLFAPAYDPQIVVTVLSESSGEGSNVAAPIAKKILEEWFSR